MSSRIVLAFAVMEFFLSLTPGPAVMLVVSQGVKFGSSRSVRGAMGILSGNAVYFTLSALGLGAILLASGRVFVFVQWAGAAYLLYLGTRMLFAKSGYADDPAGTQSNSKRGMNLFLQGLVTQLANPKAIVFFTALLPQFVSTDGDLFRQFILLGVVSIIVELPVLLAYGWAAERGKKLMTGSKLSVLPERIGGAFLVGAGVRLAFLKNS